MDLGKCLKSFHVANASKLLLPQPKDILDKPFRLMFRLNLIYLIILLEKMNKLSHSNSFKSEPWCELAYTSMVVAAK